MNKMFCNDIETMSLDKIKTAHMLIVIIVICVISVICLTYVNDQEIVDIIIYTALGLISVISIVCGIKNMQKKKL